MEEQIIKEIVQMINNSLDLEIERIYNIDFLNQPTEFKGLLNL